MAASQNKEKLDELFSAFEEICQISAWYWGCNRAGTHACYFNDSLTASTTTTSGPSIRDQHMHWVRDQINHLRGWEVKPIGSRHMAVVRHPLLIEESGSTAWRPMTDPPPKDKPILVWHDHEGDPHHVDDVPTAYGYWCDVYSECRIPGAYVAIWFEPSDPDDGPGWWFLNDDGLEFPLSPVLWKPIDKPKYNPYLNAKRIVKEHAIDKKENWEVFLDKDESRPIEEQDQLGKDATACPSRGK